VIRLLPEDCAPPRLNNHPHVDLTWLAFVSATRGSARKRSTGKTAGNVVDLPCLSRPPQTCPPRTFPLEQLGTTFLLNLGIAVYFNLLSSYEVLHVPVFSSPGSLPSLFNYASQPCSTLPLQPLAHPLTLELRPPLP